MFAVVSQEEINIELKLIFSEVAPPRGNLPVPYSSENPPPEVGIPSTELLIFCLYQFFSV